MRLNHLVMAIVFTTAGIGVGLLAFDTTSIFVKGIGVIIILACGLATTIRVKAFIRNEN